MEKIVEYSFDHDKKLIIQRISGKILLEDLDSILEKRKNDLQANDSYNVLCDARGVDFSKLKKAEKELHYNDVIKFAKTINTQRKYAIIAENPKEVVASELFQYNLMKQTNFDFRTFTTLEAALNWLKL